MAITPLAGKPAPKNLLVDLARLEREYYEGRPDMLAANDVQTFIQPDDGVTPTPVISHAILGYNRGRKEHFADGIVITPSHNPPEDGGLKYNPPNGGPAETDVTRWVQDRANELLRNGNLEVKRMPFAKAIAAPSTHQEDFVIPYVKDPRNVVDLEAIRAANLTLAVDPLGGASLPYWEPISSIYKLDISVVNPKFDATFSFMTVDNDGKIRMDCSSPYAMTRLVELKDQRAERNCPKRHCGRKAMISDPQN